MVWNSLCHYGIRCGSSLLERSRRIGGGSYGRGSGHQCSDNYLSYRHTTARYPAHRRWSDIRKESVTMRRILVILLVISILLGVSSPALAIADPDTAPQISASYVYEFLDGSVGVLMDYFLNYAALPTETATAAYLMVFYDTVSSTQFKAVAPYTFVDSGYGRGLIWILFSATEVATLGINSADIADYEVWLTGNPALSWAGDPPKTTAGIDQWNDTGDMSVLLALRILYYADILELAWSLNMIESTSEGNRL